jgi:hypothetical protein
MAMKIQLPAGIMIRRSVTEPSKNHVNFVGSPGIPFMSLTFYSARILMHQKRRFNRILATVPTLPIPPAAFFPHLGHRLSRSSDPRPPGFRLKRSASSVPLHSGPFIIPHSEFRNLKGFLLQSAIRIFPFAFFEGPDARFSISPTLEREGLFSRPLCPGPY